MNQSKKNVSVAALILAFTAPSAVLAGANCTKYPDAEKMDPKAAEAEIAKTYKIKKFKVDGNCYEIYGWNKEGKKVEIYFDQKNLSIVKQEVN